MTTTIVKQESLSEFLQKPEVAKQFSGLFKTEQDANRYMQSVIILVETSDPDGEYSLQNCSNESVLRAALRAVSLRVSVDPAARQAWIVPRRNKKTGKIEAGLQLHYSETKNRAMRTNLYQCINVSNVYEGETVMLDVYSGLHRIKLANGLITHPEETTRFVPVNERRGKVKGYLGYSKRIRGQEQTVYMSIEDIEKFVSRHNPYWDKSPSWKGDNRTVMEQKTVLLALLRKEDLGDPRNSEIREVLNESDYGDDADIVDGEPEFVDEKPGQDNVNTAFPPKEQKKEEVKTGSGRPYDPETFRTKFLEGCVKIKDNYAANGKQCEATETNRKVLANALDTYCFKKDALARHEFLRWLVEIDSGSTNDLSCEQVKAFLHIMKLSGTDFTVKPDGLTVIEIQGVQHYLQNTEG